jgi:hypothetical protein
MFRNPLQSSSNASYINKSHIAFQCLLQSLLLDVSGKRKLSNLATPFVGDFAEHFCSDHEMSLRRHIFDRWKYSAID